MRTASLGALLVLLLTPGAGFAEPAAAGFEAELTCRQEAGAGRWVCHLESRPGAGARIAWGDGVVVESPQFLQPLRSRVPASLVSGGRLARAGFAFVAAGRGSGAVVVRARVVLCQERESAVEERCRATEAVVRSELVLR